MFAGLSRSPGPRAQWSVTIIETRKRETNLTNRVSPRLHTHTHKNIRIDISRAYGGPRKTLDARNLTSSNVRNETPRQGPDGPGCRTRETRRRPRVLRVRYASKSQRTSDRALFVRIAGRVREERPRRKRNLT